MNRNKLELDKAIEQLLRNGRKCMCEYAHMIDTWFVCVRVHVARVHVACVTCKRYHWHPPKTTTAGAMHLYIGTLMYMDWSLLCNIVLLHSKRTHA